MYRWLNRESGENPELTRSGKENEPPNDTAQRTVWEVGEVG